MKNNFIFLVILIISLIALVNAFESQVFSLNTQVSEEEVNVNITNPIIVNVTTECTSGEISCSGTNYLTCVDNSWFNNGNVNGQCGYTTPATTTTGGGGGNPIVSFVKDLFNSGNDETQASDSGNEEGEINLDQNPEETVSSTNFLTAAVIGLTDFSKSPAGIVTFVVLITLAAAIISITIKKKKEIKDSKIEEKETLSEE